MSETPDVEDIVGSRFYDQSIEEVFQVLRVDHLADGAYLVYVQFADGTFFDYSVALEGSAMQRFGVSEFFSSDIIPVGDLTSATARDCDHEWWPHPDDLWDSYDAYRAHSHEYVKFVRCVKCGISGDTASFVGTWAPTMCYLCDSSTYMDNAVFHTEQYPDAPICQSCIDKHDLVVFEPEDGEADTDAG